MTKFAVVEFVDEKAVDVVAETWIEKRDGVYYSYYPRSNVATRVRRKEMPDKECWASYEIRLLSKADLCEKAIKKAKKAEETSNVDSSDSDCGRGKRNRKSNDYNESEDDGECEEDDYIVLPRKHFRDVENINPRKPPSKKARTSSCGTIYLPKPPQFYEKSASSQAAKSTPRPRSTESTQILTQLTNLNSQSDAVGIANLRRPLLDKSNRAVQLTSQPISDYEVVELPKTKEYGSAELVGDSLRLLDDGCGDIPDISNENVTDPFLHSLESNAPI